MFFVSVFCFVFGANFDKISSILGYLSRHGENSKNRTACRREHQNARLGGSEMEQISRKNASRIGPKIEAENHPKI